ncbi:MAG: polysaccharide biosynthesis protein, partial [Oscillospiraceae bacterium]|nr:polysaccharide biosynthesis protein [Oscillospiraceae bacterium]
MVKQKYITWQMVLVMVIDVVIIALTGAAALLIRFDFLFDSVPKNYFDMWLSFLPIQLVLTVLIFWFTRMYHYVWRSVSVADVAQMAVSVTIAYGLFYVITYFLGNRPPRSIYLISYVLAMGLFLLERCFLRFWQSFNRFRSGHAERRIMLIGAGSAGGMIAREFINSDRLNAKVICFIDDNETKWGKYLEGIPVVGGRDSIPDAVKKYRITSIILCLPRATAEQRKDILDICKKTSCRVQTVPGIYQLVNGEVSVSSIKDV